MGVELVDGSGNGLAGGSTTVAGSTARVSLSTRRAGFVGARLRRGAGGGVS